MQNRTNENVIKALNVVLRNELNAINQYFLHAKMLEDAGFAKLAAFTKKESIDEMNHADQLIGRILFLRGKPVVNEQLKLQIGAEVESMLENDMGLELVAIPDIKKAIAEAEKVSDAITVTLLESILASEEQHLHFLETQLKLIKSIGLQNYLQTQV